jgi:hypothetical protein
MDPPPPKRYLNTSKPDLAVCLASIHHIYAIRAFLHR